MSVQKPPQTPAEHIARAKAELAAPDYLAAQTHALIAIAELLLRDSEPEPVDIGTLPPPGAGDPRSPEWTGRCMRCDTRCQWGWCPVCQPYEYGQLP